MMSRPPETDIQFASCFSGSAMSSQLCQHFEHNPDNIVNFKPGCAVDFSIQHVDDEVQLTAMPYAPANSYR